jgi:hypothetical protein
MSKDLQFTFKRPSLEVSGEVGSLAELIGYMQEQSATLVLAFGDDMELIVQRIATVGEQPSQEAEPSKERKPRGPNKPKPAGDPTTAVAPAPIPVPDAPSAPVAPTTATLPPNELNPAPIAAASFAIPADGGIPPFLVRTAAPPVAPSATPLAPPPPVAPSAASPPPVGVLGPKVVAALDLLRVGKADGGQALADWLAAAGATVKGATYDEACRAVLMISDEKLTAAGIPAALKVA